MTPAGRSNRRGTAIGPVPNVSNDSQQQQQQSVSQQQSKSPQQTSHEQPADLLYNNYNTEFFKYDTKTSCNGPADSLSVDGSNLLLPSEQTPLVLLEPDDLALEYAVPADSINVYISISALVHHDCYDVPKLIMFHYSISGTTEQVVHRCDLYCRTASAFEEVCRPQSASRDDFTR